MSNDETTPVGLTCRKCSTHSMTLINGCCPSCWQATPISERALETDKVLRDAREAQQLWNNDWARMQSEIVTLTASLAAANKELEEEKEKAGELQALFNLQHSRSLDAMKRWQKATGRDDVWPDLGEMLKWLLERDDIATNSVETLRDVDECIEAATTQTEILTPEIHAKLLKDARHTISLCLKEENKPRSPEVETHG